MEPKQPSCYNNQPHATFLLLLTSLNSNTLAGQEIKCQLARYSRRDPP